MSDLDKIRSEVIRKSKEIPFGNSEFQNKYFVEYANLTPARAYRSLLLKMMSRLNDLKEFDFKLDEIAIDIEEWTEEKDNELLSNFDRRRAAIKIKRSESQMEYNRKLVTDALLEVEDLWEALSKYPEFTREQFENEEHAHFKLLMERKMSLPQGKEGVMESLLNIMDDESNFNQNLQISVSKLKELGAV